ncbi:MAG TPA: sodium:proton antiporter, partial [Nitrospirae bacterium]|nr:sodium:proton antiporter [Nitrospirota bacterium]
MMEAVMLGFIVAAVSPAVVVPSMISAMDKGLGTKKGIPTLILASSSLDNAYVIVVFSTLIGMFAGASNNFLLSLLNVPVSILTGGVFGALLGFGFQKLFSQAAPRATKKTLLVLGAGVLLIWLQDVLKDTVPMSGLIGVMVMGLVILEKSEVAAHAISNKLAKIWV